MNCPHHFGEMRPEVGGPITSQISLHCACHHSYLLCNNKIIFCWASKFCGCFAIAMEETSITLAMEMSGRRLGYGELTAEQRRAILAFVGGRDVFVSLPTGSGKSLCFALLPLVFDLLNEKEGSIVIVVSPLLALMQDQVHRFSPHAQFCVSK